MNKRKTLILLTNSFPYGNGEAFLENEINYLANSFEKVIIITKETNNQTKRPVLENVYVNRVRVSHSSLSKFLSIINIFDIQFIRELFKILNSKRLSSRLGALKVALFSLKAAKCTLKIVKSTAKQYKIAYNQNTILYSYWWDDLAIAASLLKKKHKDIISISRTHRKDLYIDENKYNYLPYRSFTLNQIDEFFSISQQGIDYLINNYPSFKHKFKLARLGTSSLKRDLFTIQNNKISIVSCSFVVERKRVYSIAESLLLMNSNIDINWTHFGGGKQFSFLKEFCDEINNKKKNINITLLGSVENRTVLEYYKNNNADLFIIVSESEGVPVTIMEAFSCGIPAIATNVGGVAEIVNEKCGFLLKKDCTPQDIADTIVKYIMLADSEQAAMHKAAYNMWKVNYNAEINYPCFIEQILKI
ncbi:MAG: glycosyltransferase [Bacteroidales bacterium]|nr:glycosyltransferase [Bacteroidales bacterium]